MTERWRVLDDRWTNPFTGEPERHICKSRADDATVIAVEGPHCDDDARWVAAALNAVDGVPTEVLEAGVVVVPVELAQRLLKRCRDQQWEHNRLSEQAADTGMILSAEAFAAAAAEAEADADALETLLSRLQQNGGE